MNGRSSLKRLGSDPKERHEDDISSGTAPELENLAERLKELQLRGRALMQEFLGAVILRPIDEYETTADRGAGPPSAKPSPPAAGSKPSVPPAETTNDPHQSDPPK